MIENGERAPEGSSSHGEEGGGQPALHAEGCLNRGRGMRSGGSPSVCPRLYRLILLL